MRAASSLSARGARRLYVASARTTERRMSLSSRPTSTACSPSLTTAAAAAAAVASTSSPTASTSSPTTFSLYSHPRLYDAVFAFRDFDAEAQFLVDAWKLYGESQDKQPLSSFLDVGCGTGRHGAALARLLSSAPSPPSSPPLFLFALDSSPEMLSAASKAAEEAGCPLRQAIEADMTRGFEISQRVQLALCALGTLAHALPAASNPDAETEDPALGALRAASAALVPGGLLILELPAAGDLFDGTLLSGDAWDVPAGAWRKEENAGDKNGSGSEKPEEPEQKRRIGQISKKKKVAPSSPALIVEYGLPDDDFDPVSQVLRRTVVVSEASEGGEAGDEVGREEVPQRLFTPAEVRALAREAGFRVAAELGDMELGGDGEDEGSIPTAREGDRYVAVLVKKE